MLLNLLGLFQSKDFISVDFSGSSVKVARASVQDNSLSLSLTDKQAVKDVDDGNKVEKYTEALREIKTRNAISNRENVVFSLPTNSVIVRHVELPSMPNQRLSEVIKYEAESHIPFPIEDVNLDYHVLEETEEGTRVLLVVVKNEKLDKYLEVLRNVELRPEMVDISAFSLFNLYQKLKPSGEDQQEASQPKVLVDIGHDNTDIIIFQDETLYYARSASVAGRSMTEAVSEELDVDFDRAEELKVDYGNLPLSESPVDEGSAPAAPPSESSDEDSTVDEESPPEPPDEAPPAPGEEDASEPPPPPSSDESDDELTMDVSGDDSSEDSDESEPPPPPGTTEQQPETPDDLDSPAPESAQEEPPPEPSEEVAQESPPDETPSDETDESIDQPPEPPGPPDSDEEPTMPPPEPSSDEPDSPDAVDDLTMDSAAEEQPDKSGSDEDSSVDAPGVPESGEAPAEESRPAFLDEEEDDGEEKDREEEESPETPPSELDLDVESGTPDSKSERSTTDEPDVEPDADQESEPDLSLDPDAPSEPSESDRDTESSDDVAPLDESSEKDIGLEGKSDETLDQGSGDEGTLDSPASSGDSLQGSSDDESLDIPSTDPGDSLEPEDDEDSADTSSPQAPEAPAEEPELEPDVPDVGSEVTEEAERETDTEEASEGDTVADATAEDVTQDDGVDEDKDENEDQDQAQDGDEQNKLDDLSLGERRKPEDESDSEESDEGQDPPGLGAAANTGAEDPPPAEFDEEALRSALQSQVDRLINELRQTFDYFQNEMDGEDVGEIILCGSGCKLNNLPAYLEDELTRETRRFDPLAKMKGLGVDDLQSMLVVAGLQLRSVPVDSTLAINLLPQEIVRRRERKKRNQKLIANGVLAGVLVLQVLVWLFYSYRIRKNHFLKSKNQLDKVQPIVKRVEELNKTQEQLQKRIAVIDDLEKRQGRILPILNGLNQLPEDLADRTWFENFSISDGDPHPILSLDGVTGDFQDTSRIYGWFQNQGFVVDITDQSQGRTTLTVNDQERSMVRFSLNSSITFNPAKLSSDTDTE